MELKSMWQLDLGQEVGQLRAAPIRVHPGEPMGVLLVYAADFDVDPYEEMFFFPRDTLKMT